MRMLAHACLFTAAVLAAPSAGALTAGAPSNCTKDKCEVVISISGNTCGSGIAVSMDPIIVAVGSGPVTINWKVIGGWEFDEKIGIAFEMPGNQIKPPSMNSSNKQLATAVDLATAKGTFKYDINLVRSGTSGDKCARDPTIVNH